MNVPAATDQGTVLIARTHRLPQHPLRQAPPRGNFAVLAERPQGAEQAQKE